jgi:gas vesicle protein
MNKKAVSIGLGIGLVVGGMVALLTSPAKGKETRANIVAKFTETKDTIGRKIKAVKEA